MAHIFSFDGGEKLAKMGATWFVSYAYYDRIDRSHTDWENVGTWKYRKSVYNNSKDFHRYWLQQVSIMSNDLLKRNTLGISPTETKRMAEIILNKIDKE